MKINFKIKDFIQLGGDRLSKDVMASKVMIATGDTGLVEFANKLWELIVETDYLRPSVHGVLIKGLTHKEASETYDIKESYLKNLIGLEGKRLGEDLGIDILPYLLGEEEMPTRASVDALNTIVEGLISVSDKLNEDLFGKLTFGIDNKRTVRQSTLSDDAFIKLVQGLDFLSKPKMQSKLDEVGDNNLGYLTYLIRTDDKYLTKDDQTRKEIIKEVWWL